MRNVAAELAQRLLHIKAIKLNPKAPFTWASGLRSPIYCDNRIVLSYPDHRRFVIQAFAEQAASFAAADIIAGVATAGIAHGALLAEQLDKPFIYVRSKAKGHGRQNQIEGELQAGARVLVIEDLISTGGSCLKAVEALREAGAQISGVLAIFTYGLPKATQAFTAAKVPYATLTNYETLLQVAIEHQYIDQAEQQTLSVWSEDPAAWSATWQA